MTTKNKPKPKPRIRICPECCFYHESKPRCPFCGYVYRPIIGGTK